MINGRIWMLTGVPEGSAGSSATEYSTCDDIVRARPEIVHNSSTGEKFVGKAARRKDQGVS